LKIWKSKEIIFKQTGGKKDKTHQKNKKQNKNIPTENHRKKKSEKSKNKIRY
jgi:hypothetical protein